MRHGLKRFKLLLPWSCGVLMCCLFLVLPIMFGLVFLVYGTSAPRVFDLANKLAVVAIVYSLLFAIVPSFQVNVYLDAHARTQYLRENIVAGWWMMRYMNFIGVWFLLCEGIVFLSELSRFALGNIDPKDDVIRRLSDPES